MIEKICSIKYRNIFIRMVNSNYNQCAPSIIRKYKIKL